MLDMPVRNASPLSFANLFTVAEAAWAAGAEDSFINHEVDKKVVEIGVGGRRLLARCDLFYLRAVRDVAPSLKIELRKRIYHSVRKAVESGSCEHIIPSVLGSFDLPLQELSIKLNPRVAKIRAARDAVQIRKGFKGSEYVVRGTRIPVQTLVEIIQAGTPIAEVANEYDLTQQQVILSYLFVRLHPRRGRPNQSPSNDSLSDLGPVDRVDIEEIGEFRPYGFSRSR